ncbi:MAG: hypothetical protein NT154_04870 [Verrucomicrobia bacterium]|nr:hypothetical protein [Verrucomicrobiota bacterium]
MVRIWENTLFGIDRLTENHTGADVVTETQLDLKAGHITGTVKKMSAASKYEVRIPNAVVGIHGTVYDLYADGVLKILSGTGVIAYPGTDGTSKTQVVGDMQQFSTASGVLSPLPSADASGLSWVFNQLVIGAGPSAQFPVSGDLTVIYISPH